MNIYVASSWRNEVQPSVVQSLSDAGHLAYDFKEPSPGRVGFRWSDIGTSWKDWTSKEFCTALAHQKAVEGFRHDYEAMEPADAFVMG